MSPIRRVVAAVLLASAPLAGGSAFYSGTLPDANQLFESVFTLSAATDLTLTTSSWVAGDFDPVLWLFNESGTQIAKNDDISPFFPYNRDAQIALANVPAGTYTAILSAFDQHYWGPPEYIVPGWSDEGDFFGRPPEYALTITTCGTADFVEIRSGIVEAPRGVPAVPEPGSAVLLLGAAALLAGWRARHQNRSRSTICKDLAPPF